MHNIFLQHKKVTIISQSIHFMLPICNQSKIIIVIKGGAEMKYNLYSLSEDELINICVENLFDRKDTYILKAIILNDFTIEAIANDLNMSSNGIYKRIKKIKQKLRIVKWTDSLVD